VRAPHRLAAVVLSVALAACGGREPRCPTCPAAAPLDATAMIPTDAPPALAPLHDTTPAVPLDELSLVIALDAAHPGRVGVRVVWYGAPPLTVALPAALDQLEWYEPGRAVDASIAPYLAWSAWRPDTGVRMARPSRPAASRWPSRHVLLAAGAAHDAEVDLGPAFAQADGDDRRSDDAPRGWCARAWILGGAAPVPSNVVCWPRG
jgi:hypothetical protein